MKKYIAIAVLMMGATLASAGQRKIEATIIDRDSQPIATRGGNVRVGQSLTMKLEDGRNGRTSAPKIGSNRTVIGSIASVDAHFESGRPVTTIRVLEFSKDYGLGEPTLTDVRLCGDQSGSLYGISNVSFVYSLISPSALTGCLPLVSAEPWQDSSRWNSITWDKSKVHGSRDLEKIIRGIGNGPIK
jgi:hypothetical protein